MSSPFQIGFMGKNPMKTITLNDKDLNSTNSASSQPAAEISYEGQGGVDYENDPRFAENPEGQGGKDYEADDSVAKMKGDQGSHKMTAGEYGRHLDRHMKTGGHHDDSTLKENKKKTEISPLNSYANPGGEVYLSDQPSFQKLQSDIQGAADKVMDAVSGNKNATKKKADAGLVTSGKMSQTEFDNIYGKKTKANA